MKKLLHFLLTSLALTGCASFPASQSLTTRPDSLPRGLTLDLGAETAGRTDFRLTGEALENAVLRGTASHDGEAWNLQLTEMDWFSNWSDGWTEATFSLDGSLKLTPAGDSWTLSAAKAPTIVGVDRAALRLAGDYFNDDRALSLFKNRWERIQAATAHLASLDPSADWDWLKPEFRWDKFAWVKNYQEDVRAVFFPEVYGWDHALAGFKPSAADALTYAEGVTWNQAYSQAAFPDSLRQVRDSGTLLRDFEETAGLWRISSLWSKLWEQKFPAAVFNSVKR